MRISCLTFVINWDNIRLIKLYYIYGILNLMITVLPVYYSAYYYGNRTPVAVGGA
jgi:hypothetical protein